MDDQPKGKTPLDATERGETMLRRMAWDPERFDEDFEHMEKVFSERREDLAKALYCMVFDVTSEWRRFRDARSAFYGDHTVARIGAERGAWMLALILLGEEIPTVKFNPVEDEEKE